MRISDDSYLISSPGFFVFLRGIRNDERLIYSVNYNTIIKLWNVIQNYEEKARRHNGKRYDAGNSTPYHRPGNHYCLRTTNDH
jgi:hypothetical protein